MLRPALAAALMLASTIAVGGECKAQIEPLQTSGQFDSESIFHLCADEAAAGDAEALYYVSFFYFGSNDFAHDTSKGIQVVQAAADKGYAQAQFWMGWQHESGQHLPRDYEAALNWYRAAAESNSALAISRLERVYRNGELGVMPDAAVVDEYARKRPCCQSGT
jgi:TPR repeat protein